MTLVQTGVREAVGFLCTLLLWSLHVRTFLCGFKRSQIEEAIQRKMQRENKITEIESSQLKKTDGVDISYFTHKNTSYFSYFSVRKEDSSACGH